VNVSERGDEAEKPEEEGREKVRDGLMISLTLQHIPTSWRVPVASLLSPYLSTGTNKYAGLSCTNPSEFSSPSCWVATSTDLLMNCENNKNVHLFKEVWIKENAV
jgi:hypothetical protein